MIIECVPAYGLDYKTAAATKKAWKAGADFQIVSIGPDEGKYINKNDCIPEDTIIQLRYNGLRGVLPIY